MTVERNWVKFSYIHEGMYLQADGGCECIPVGTKRVGKDGIGLYVECSDGRHYLHADTADGLVVGFSVNPIIEATNKVTELRPCDDYGDPINEVSEEDNEANTKIINELFYKTLALSDKRLALVTIRAASLREKSYSSKRQRYEHDTIYCAAQFTPDAFEATLVGLALDGWWNDVLDAACKTLDINPDTDLDEQLAEKYPL